jgi:hypothetical protein
MQPAWASAYDRRVLFGPERAEARRTSRDGQFLGVDAVFDRDRESVERIPPQARAYAASALLDRGHGKPAQAHAGPSGSGPVTLTLIEEPSGPPRSTTPPMTP